MTSRRKFIKIGIGAGIGALVAVPGAAYTISRVFGSTAIPQTPLLGANIPKFIDPVPTFVGKRESNAALLVTMEEFQQKVLPASVYEHLHDTYRHGTYVWGYRVGDSSPSFPGTTVEARHGTPTTITYVNNLPSPSPDSKLAKLLTIDQTIHWADPHNQMDSMKPYVGTIPTVVHLHGAEVPSASDGTPDGWFTRDGIHGMGYCTVQPTGANAAVFAYPNTQEATTLWFHDHALGLTRINVFAGLASFYLLRDQFDTGKEDNPLHLPAGAQEIELMIQDRQFDTNGQLLFPDGTPTANPTGLNGGPPNPAIHPFWIPEFFGDVMVVNGKSWPYLEVEPRRYRFRLLDACNARFLEMNLVDATTQATGPTIWQIGTDGGLLDTPVKLNSASDDSPTPLFIAPSERADVIIDFAGFAGKTLTLTNTAFYPYPSGNTPDPSVDGQIMQFRVTKRLSHPDTTYNPAVGMPLRGKADLSPALIRLANPTTGTLGDNVHPVVTRQLVLVEVEGPGGPIEVLVNNTKWDGFREGTTTPLPGSKIGKMGLNMPAVAANHHSMPPYITEMPRVGATEVWEIINLTMDAHPIHIHLIQFQLINRQYYDKGRYRVKYDSHFPGGEFMGVQPNGSWGRMKYPRGVYIPGYGPPLNYDTPISRGAIGGNPDVTPYLQQAPMPPNPNEAGWKDTLKMFPDQVTRIVIRWAPVTAEINDATPGKNLYAFDPTIGPGYVWHCHILDHEDNEMMRPYAIIK